MRCCRLFMQHSGHYGRNIYPEGALRNQREVYYLLDKMLIRIWPPHVKAAPDCLQQLVGLPRPEPDWRKLNLKIKNRVFQWIAIFYPAWPGTSLRSWRFRQKSNKNRIQAAANPYELCAPRNRTFYEAIKIDLSCTHRRSLAFYFVLRHLDPIKCTVNVKKATRIALFFLTAKRFYR
jgi:hypothetical protein